MDTPALASPSIEVHSTVHSPSESSSSTQLRYKNLSRHHLRDFEVEESWADLVELDLSENELTSLPSTLKKLSALQKLKVPTI